MMPLASDLPLTLKKLTETIVDDDSARRLLESIRWPDGPVCPHCGEIGNAKRLEARPDSKKPCRKGLLKCYGCLEQFSVTVGTVFEDSHIPLHKWLLAAYMLCASKKGTVRLRSHAT